MKLRQDNATRHRIITIRNDAIPTSSWKLMRIFFVQPTV